MSKIDDKIALAFVNKRNVTITNTTVKDRAVYLHGNKIAWIDETGALHISHCGWLTRATMSRLSAILHAFSTGMTVYLKGGGLAWYTKDGVIKPFVEPIAIMR
jgi:hypothetical protein